MDGASVLQFFAYLLPTLVTGAIAYFFFKMHTQNEEGRRRYLLQKDMAKNALPIRLQAYERMALFLERIAINSLVVRVTPLSQDKTTYENLLIQNIETEFDHNLSQQIYMTDQCWSIIKTAKSATIRSIRSAAMSSSGNADKLREAILNQGMDKQSPSAAALAYVKKEVSEIF